MKKDQPRAMIFTGGRLGPWSIDLIQPDDLLFGADRGALFLVQHGFRPQLSIGDFDSVTEHERELIRQSSAEIQ